MPDIDKYFLIGKNISHSKSPQIWNNYFLNHNIAGMYSKHECENEGAAYDFLKNYKYRACNITTPYKKTAYSACDRCDDYSKFVEGTNFIINKDGILYGYNTDGLGCMHDLLNKGIVLENLCVIVLGTGPTSQIIAYTLSCAGACVEMLSRNPNQELIDKMSKNNILVLTYEQAKDDIGYAKLIINATPLGMKECDPSPLNKSYLNKCHVVYDCQYACQSSQLKKDTEQANGKYFDGREMLFEQAKVCQSILFD